MEITIKSIAANIINASTMTERQFIIGGWQVQYTIIFPEADLTKGYHSLDGIIGWKGHPEDIIGIIDYIKSFYK